jgi:hypothetical protein
MIQIFGPPTWWTSDPDAGKAFGPNFPRFTSSSRPRLPIYWFHFQEGFSRAFSSRFCDGTFARNHYSSGQELIRHFSTFFIVQIFLPAGSISRFPIMALDSSLRLHDSCPRICGVNALGCETFLSGTAGVFDEGDTVGADLPGPRDGDCSP